ISLATHQSNTQCDSDADCADTKDRFHPVDTPTCTKLKIGDEERKHCTAMADFPHSTPTPLRNLNTRNKTDDIGVPYFPKVSDTMTLINPDRSDTELARFRDRCARHGRFLHEDFDQDGDHVVDNDWGGPDHFSNIWPLRSSINRSAGPNQNQHQKISFTEGPNGPPHPDMKIGEFKRQGFHLRSPPHKFFVIRDTESYR
ncbi:MAG TPA: hypothetical protein VLC08_05605, partial [Chitinolyticbacter sp.]|nr:hypothetical protein [Chitinolyticbacter sp.]